MFFTGNDNYMQDLYCFNQVPNSNLNMNTYPNSNSFQNNMWSQQNGGYYNSNNIQSNFNQINNLNSLYPSIYRIIMPVIVRVLQNSNYQFLNEDVLNNMVDTVYNIVEGQIDYSDEPNNNINNNILNDYTISNSSNSSNNSANNQVNKSTDSKQQISDNSNQNSCKDSALLKDLIKILFLREIIKRVTLGTFLY